MTFDEKVAAALKNQVRCFARGKGDELTLLSAHPLPTHVPGDEGMIITYSRSVLHTGTGVYHETRFVIYPGATDKQTSYSGGILAQTWSKE